MGYNVSTPDVNESGLVWNWSERKKSFIPPLTSVKGLGDNAVKEIMENRPYTNLEQMLFDADGEWYHSKLNRTGFAALCKVEALDALEEMWQGKIPNHRALHEVIITNYDTLRKGQFGMTIKKAQKTNAQPLLPQLIQANSDLEDWSRIEKLEMYQEMCSAIRDDLAFPPEMIQKIKNADVKSVLQMEQGEKGIAWFCAVEAIKKTTKNKKVFYTVKIIDDENNTGNLRIWGDLGDLMQPYTIWLANVSNDPGWGASTNAAKIRSLVK